MRTLIVFVERPGRASVNANPDISLIGLLGVTPEEYTTSVFQYTVAMNGYEKTGTPECRRRVQHLLDLYREQYEGFARFLFIGRSTIQAAPEEYRRMVDNQFRKDVMLIPYPGTRTVIYRDPVFRADCEHQLRRFMA